MPISKKNRINTPGNAAQRPARFFLPKPRISFARTITTPEEVVVGRAIRAENYRALFHTLQQRSAANDLIIGMCYQDQGSPQQRPQSFHCIFKMHGSTHSTNRGTSV